MDKKNTILGIICIAGGLYFMFTQQSQLSEQQRQQALEQANQEVAALEGGSSTTPADAAIAPAGADSEGDAMLNLIAQDVAQTSEIVETVEVPEAEAKTVKLANDYIEVDFTSSGGAIREVAFLTTKRGERDDYIFNEDGFLPALSLSIAKATGETVEFNRNFAVESQSDTAITFAFNAGNGLTIRRSYELAAGGSDSDPYVIKHSTSFANSSAAPKAISNVYLNLGTFRPANEKAQPNFLNVGYFNGDKSKFIAINKLTGSSGFLGIGASEPRQRIEKDDVNAQWTSVKNQFFAAVLSSSEVATDVLIDQVPTAPKGDGKKARAGITGSAGYEFGTIAPGTPKTINFDYYVGPKEFKRLQALGNHQDEVMQFGFLSFISKLLLSFMYLIHSFVPSWGWSIIIMTICIKGVFWPLTAQASKSQKRMAKIQGPMAELKEKYADNPQKMQQETLKLFREHRVNPVAGCLPLFIQMPIFLGLFYMLRTASELRHEPFLWVQDLSMPDTMFEVAGFPINILPIIMGVTMFLQMSMMPVSPTADPMQQKIFKFLPFVFLIFLYNFSSGLVLYWTMQNILTIIQQKITNAMPDEPLQPAVATGKGGKSKKKK
ncbi:MAG: membrane protein insertase YidC [Coraliomargarita sp.]